MNEGADVRMVANVGRKRINDCQTDRRQNLQHVFREGSLEVGIGQRLRRPETGTIKSRDISQLMDPFDDRKEL